MGRKLKYTAELSAIRELGPGQTAFFRPASLWGFRHTVYRMLKEWLVEDLYVVSQERGGIVVRRKGGYTFIYD